MSQSFAFSPAHGSAPQPCREISQDELKTLLDYDPETGIFIWKHRPRAQTVWNAQFAGERAGSLSKGYVCIEILGRAYFAHRLAWLYVYGEMPDGIIDHISHDKVDNRIINLRVVGYKESARNRTLYRSNKSGIPGVRFDAQRGKWVAKIWDNGRTHLLGRFEVYDDAVEARKSGEKQFGYHPNHGVNPT